MKQLQFETCILTSMGDDFTYKSSMVRFAYQVLKKEVIDKHKYARLFYDCEM